MATDLTTVKDHPATLLREHYAPQHPITSSVYTTAAGALDGYEQVNNVTFAALHNDTLAEVQHAFAKADEAPIGSEEWVDAMKDLKGFVSDLLGLGE